MRLHNFIKAHFENKKDIYFASVDMLNNTKSDSSIPIMQSSSTQMNNLRHRIIAKIWENYQIYQML